MKPTAHPTDSTVVRRIFETWSIEIPTSFDELFVAEDGHWHAHDPHRSVSVTSVLIADDHGPVSEARLVDEFWPNKDALLHGDPVGDLPAGILGWAVIASVEQPARAAMALQGILFAHGRLLVTTITSDDLEWARATWLSIRSHGVPAIRPH